MQNPKTTISGYLGMLGTVCSFLGTVLGPTTPWGIALLAIGAALGGGANSIGNILSKDGGH